MWLLFFFGCFFWYLPVPACLKLGVFFVWSIMVMDHHDMVLVDRGVPLSLFCSTLFDTRLVLTPVRSQTDLSRVLLTFGFGLPSMPNSLTSLHPRSRMLRRWHGYHNLFFVAFDSPAVFVERFHVCFSFLVVLALQTPAWEPVLQALLSSAVRVALLPFPASVGLA